MCTAIAEKAPVSGSAKGPTGWFALGQAYISYDHPLHAGYEHALNLDFVNEALGPGCRVAVELSRESARALAHRILAVLAQADVYEGAAS
jgi:hypothetical protein